MANAKAHHLLEPEKHVLVATDKQPREAEYHTEYEDGTTAKTRHMLYWHMSKDKTGKETGEVRSMPMDEWTAAGRPPPVSVEPAQLPYPGAVVHFILDTIDRHVAATVTATPYTDHYTVDVAVFNGSRKPPRVEWWTGVAYDGAAKGIGTWHWPDQYFEDRVTPVATAMVEPGEGLAADTSLA